ncbi:D-alanyl-D-alanine dipeptidase [Alphaproteobacteria bacterium SO-S41]|nr:D-alanyl-D-alanine dipeptidase [Alphaproteobacteria bacterium SO-S41]
MIVLAGLVAGLFAADIVTPVAALPPGFVHLYDTVPDIIADMRYAGAHNFTGQPVPGYEAPVCIVTDKTADALRRANAALEPHGYKLMVFDCYRPARAVAAFVAWAEGPDETAKAEFYPRVPKSELFQRGYIAAHSRHSAGSTVDLTLVHSDQLAGLAFEPGAPYIDCTAPYGTRFNDGALDMGTGYDCFDDRAHGDSAAVSAEAQANRKLLRDTMIAAGFRPYAEEWWHFTLADEPFPDEVFDFTVR